MSTDERDEAARFQHDSSKRIMAALDKMQLLILDVANWYNHAAALGKLRQKRRGGRRCGRRHQDGIEWRKFREAEGTVSAMDVDVCVTQAKEALGGGGAKVRAIFDGEDFFREAREDGSLIAATGADLQHSFTAVEA